MNRLLTTIATFAVCAFAFTTPASAKPVNWVMNSIYTDPSGNQYKGSFTYDADTGTFSNQALRYSTPTNPTIYFCTVTSVANNSLSCDQQFKGGAIGLGFALSGPLTNAGGALSIAGSGVDLIGNPARFGSVNLGQLVTQTYTFTIPSAGTLAATPYVALTQGAQNLDFQVATTQPSNACVAGLSYGAGDTCAVNVTFAPTRPYQRMGAVQLMDLSGKPIATLNLSGIGVGPQVAFPKNAPAVQLATTFSFSAPSSVAVDGSGNFIVADSNGVHKMAADRSSVIQLASSFDFHGANGVAVDGSGNVMVTANLGTGAVGGVYEVVAVNGVVSSTSNVIQLSTSTSFSRPAGVAVDSSGNVFVADSGSTPGQGSVFEILAAGATVSADSDAVKLAIGSVSTPIGVAVDSNGNVYFTDGYSGGESVKEIVAVNGRVSAASSVVTLPSVGGNPYGVTVDGGGNLFVTTPYKVEKGGVPNGSVQEIVAANGSVSPSSSVITVWSTLSQALGVVVNGDRNVFVADSANTQLVEIDYSDPPSLDFSNVTNAGSRSLPQGVTVQNIGNAILNQTSLVVSPNFAQVAGSRADCPAVTGTLASGESCSIALVFAPTTSGPLTGSAVLTNDALNSPQSFGLRGTAVPASYNVTIATVPSGLVFTLDGTNYTAPQTLSLAGGTHTLSTQTQAGTLGTKYSFSGWSDGSAIANHTITVSGNMTDTATFSTLYLLTLSANPTTGGTVTGGGYLTAGSTATITATPNTGYLFTGWSGATTIASTSATVTMTAPLNATANFGLAPTPFGSVNVGQSATQTYTFTVPSAGTLANPPYVVLTKGAQNLDFQAAATQPANACVTGHSYNAGDTCAVNVTFAPTKPWQRMGAVQLMGSSGTPIAAINLTGTGVGPQVAFPNSAVATSIKGSGSGVGGGSFHDPHALAVDGNGNVFVADAGFLPDFSDGGLKEIVAVNGVVSATSKVILIAKSPFPGGVAVDGAGNVFFGDSVSGAVYEIVAVNGSVSANSRLITVGSGFARPAGVAVDGSGDVFVDDAGPTSYGSVYKIVAVNGSVSAGSSVITLASGIHYPKVVGTDSAGNLLFVDDGVLKQIRAIEGVVSASSDVITVGGGLNLTFAGGMAVDGAGNVFLIDCSTYDSCVGDHTAVLKEIVAVDGAVSADSSVINLGGALELGGGLAVDSAGNVFSARFGSAADGNLVSDVKKINFSDPPSVNFSATNAGSQSAAQSVTVQNIGNAPLIETSLVESANFAQVTGSGTPTDCPAGTGALAAGATCNISLVFAPTTGGSLSGTSTLTNNNLNVSGAQQVIPLSGTATGSLTVTVSVPAGVSYVLNGTPYTGTQTVPLGPGQYTLSTTATQSLGTGSQSVWVSWSDNGAISHTVTVGTSSLAVIGNFKTQYLLTTAVSPANSGTVTGGGVYYDAGSNASISASPAANYAFVNWTGASFGSATSANTTVSMTGPLTVTANFQLGTVPATVGTNVPGVSFTVDNVTYTSTQNFNWAYGSQHTIATTSPQAGTAGTQYVFTQWSDLGAISHTVTVAQQPTIVSVTTNSVPTANSYIANFKTQYMLSVTANPSNGGTVTGGGYFDAGSNQPVTASPNAGFVFSSWTGTVLNPSNAQTSVSLSGPATVAANFTAIYAVTVGTNIPGLSFGVDGTTYTSTQTFQWVTGTPHTLTTTTPQTGAGGVLYTFGKWSDGGGLVDNITASQATAYTANFQTTSTAMLTGTATPATIRNDYPGFVGMKFTVGATPINVLSLGRVYLNGNKQTHIVKLVDAVSGLDVPNASVSLTMTPGTVNTYEYAPLTTTVILPANSSYYLLTQEFAGGDTWYDFAHVTPNSAFTVNGAEYQASVGSYILQAPGLLSYGTPNMLFVGGTIIPPPVVSMTSPANGAAVQGTIQLTATATAAPGLTITNVQFRLNGSNFGAPLGSAPYTLPLDTTTLLTAMNTVTAVATDSNGGTTTATPVTFTIANSPSAPGPFLTGTPSGTLRNDFSGFVGMKFTVGSSPLSVSQLGRWVVAGNSATHTVKLVNANGADVPNASVSLSLAGAPTGQYAYAPLASAVTLAANTTYYLVTQEVAGGDRWYDFNAVTANNAAGTVNSALYQQSNGGYAAIDTGSNSYVPPNFLFTPSGGVTSAPPTVVITAPPSNSTVSGTVALSAAATPAAGLTITGVQFRINGANVGPLLTTAPYNYSLDTTTLANATDNLTAVATDSAGITGTSATVILTINNPTVVPPSGSAFLTGAPVSTTTLRNDYQGAVGLKFTVADTPLVVSQLGRWKVAGNSGSHVVKLVQASGADLPGGSVTINMAPATAGQYAYAALASPVTLLARTSYYLVTQEFAGGDQWYDYAPVAASSGTVNAPAYQQPNGAYVTLSPGSSSYGPPNFLFSAGSTPPTQPPPTVTITLPTAGTVSGSITLTATAIPSPGLTIVKVQFQLNGNNVSSPLDTTTLANGQYTLTALATDSAGSVGTSAGVTITVSNPLSSTTPLLTGAPSSGLRNDFSGFVGLKFTVGSTPLKVSQLGRWVVSGNTATHTVKLVDAVTGADIVSATVIPTTSGQFNYAPASVTLAANHAYFLLTQETNAGDRWYDAGTVTANSAVTINGPAYQQSNGAYTLLFNGTGSYGPVSLLFGF